MDFARSRAVIPTEGKRLGIMRFPVFFCLSPDNHLNTIRMALPSLYPVITHAVRSDGLSYTLQASL